MSREAQRKVVVVNPNSNVSTTEMLLRSAALTAERASMDLRGVTAPLGPLMIVDPQALAESADTVVSTALLAIDSERTDGIIVGAFGDPGADRLRSLVDIPVVGIGASAIETAAQSGPFAIATTTGLLAACLDQLVADTVGGHNYVGTFITEGDPSALAHNPEGMYRALEQAVDRAGEAGAHTVIIGGGPLSDTARRLAERTDIRIIEPMPAAIEAMAALLDRRADTTDPDQSAEPAEPTTA